MRPPAAHRRERRSVPPSALPVGPRRAGDMRARPGDEAGAMVADQRDEAAAAFTPAPAPGVFPPNPPPPVAPPAPKPAPPPTACPAPVAVRNGPFHAPIDTAAAVGMEIAITLTSSTGVDADMASVEDSEQVGLSFNHTGSFTGLPPLPSNQSGFMPGHPIPNDRHTLTRSLIVDRADHHGGNGSFEKQQLDIFKAPACGVTTPQAIPKSGYIIKRIITTGPGTKITFRTEKRAAACTVNGFSTGAGPSGTQADDVIVRA